MNALPSLYNATRQTPGFEKRGVCPALSAPMPTGDGLLVRLSPVAAGLSPNQLIGLCESAARHGNGVIEVTARGSMQFRGLSEKSWAMFVGDVDALGIAVGAGVPVETGPLAGLDPAEIADPAPLAECIRDAIADAGVSDRLGPKVSVVVDGGGHSGLDAVSADVRLTAYFSPDAKVGGSTLGTGDEALWQVAVAGDALTSTRLGTVGSANACDVVLLILEAIAALGVEARARDVGFAPVSEIVRSRFLSAETEQNLQPARPFSTLIDLADGRVALAVALPFGSVEASRLMGFAHAAQTHGVTDFRLAPPRTLLALCQDREAAVALRDAATTLGFITEGADPRLHVFACAGAPACASGHIPARAIAETVAASFSDLLGAGFDIHISGCAKGCAHPGPAALTLVGSETGIGMIVGGTARDRATTQIAPDHVAQAVDRLEASIRTAPGALDVSGDVIARLRQALAQSGERST